MTSATCDVRRVAVSGRSTIEGRNTRDGRP